ncbi:MAG: hypothetical protein V7K68_04185 [Nostoc sp.]|uniref:hypothetical protein n=1 Tax=Nostoc sp. TaxID=1180 RepID=UPI002FF55C03
MVSQIQPPTQPEVIYPDSDGQPVANNTIQFGWIVEIKQNIEWLFANDPVESIRVNQPIPLVNGSIMSRFYKCQTMPFLNQTAEF